MTPTNVVRLSVRLVRVWWSFLCFFVVIYGCAAHTNTGYSAADPDSAGAVFDSMWREYKSRFISSDGNLVDSYHGITHSEGQGTAMLFAAAASDRVTFDQVWKWTRDNLQREDDLFFWRWDARSSPPVTDPNNATDGDILITWALLKAYGKWGDAAYHDEALKIMRAMKSRLAVDFSGYTVLLPGSMYFADLQHLTFNPSYLVLPAFSSFARYDNTGLWQEVYDDGLRVLRAIRSTPWVIPADWMSMNRRGEITVSAKHDPVSGYDAIRIPLYLAWCKHTEDLEPFKSIWDEQGGWRSAPSWIDLESKQQAAYDPEPGVLAVRSLAYNQLDDVLRHRQPAKDYFSASLMMFSLMASREQGCLSATDRDS